MNVSLKVGLLFIQCALVSVCAGRDVFTQQDFDSLIQRLYELNQQDPSLALARSEPARAFLEEHDTLRNRVYLAAALAPSEMLKRGVAPVRQNLVKYLRPAIESPFYYELVPVLRLAIADLCHRNGEIRFGFFHTSEALKLTNEKTPKWIRFRILDQMARLNQSAGYYHTALQLIDQMERFENFEKWIHPVEYRLRKAALHLFASNEKQSDAILAEVSDLMAPGLDQQLVGMYWMQRVWTSLEEGRANLAEEELEQARNSLKNCTSLLLQADFLVLAAVVEQLRGRAADEVKAMLENAESRYTTAGYSSRYPEMLMKVVRGPNLRFIAEVPDPFLRQLAKFAHNESSLLAYSEGLSAAAELLRREGRNSEGLEKLRMSRRHLTHFAKRIDARQREWDSRNPEMLFAVSESWEVSIFYYIFLTLSILVVLLLLLSIKVGTQRHVNRQLAQSVEKARLAEQVAEASSRLKSQFLANVSHELKTPMSGLVGMASLLDELLTDPLQRKYLSTIRTCSKNLLVLMNDLLDLGRMESGALEIEKRQFSARETIDHSLDLIRGTASEKGLELKAEVGSNVPGILIGDPTRIGQILSNLLHNAIKFTSRGSISLEAGFERTLGVSGNLIISVRDTGIGIPSEHLHTLFEPFNRLNTNGGADSDGSGLGLAICKKLVELMSGSISVQSESGHGSCFTVKIPVKIPEADPVD